MEYLKNITQFGLDLDLADIDWIDPVAGKVKILKPVTPLTITTINSLLHICSGRLANTAISTVHFIAAKCELSIPHVDIFEYF